MSVIIGEDSKGWIIDHAEFIKKIYTTVEIQDHEKVLFGSFIFNKHLFEILTPFLSTLEAKNVSSNEKPRKKRIYSDCLPPSCSNSTEIMMIKSALKALLDIENITSNYVLPQPSKEDFEKNNKQARDCSTSFFRDICQKNLGKCSGGNTSERPILVNIDGHDYLIPSNSKFYNFDIEELVTTLSEESKFDFILMDPPWWNKYVRRRKKKQETDGYKMMYNEEVSALPVESWLAPDALVAVWCTNCARHVQDVVSQWFPKWGLCHIATWYWVKVTRSGEPVCQFSPPPGKQPYERILFGSRSDRTIRQPPDSLCFVSVPSAIHSHKPPLVEVMKQFLPQQPRCLELFARYLLPNWTSVGNQVLALQNTELYIKVQDCDYS